MKKSRIVEWTCDKCGKTFEGSRICRPYKVRRAKIRVDLTHDIAYRRKYEFCPECAYGLVDMIHKYVEGENEEKSSKRMDL